MKRPLIIAHRGDSCHFPENSAPAFENLGWAVGGIETDIQLSRDGVAVLYHDRTLKKITGGDERVYSQTLASLRKLDSGGWFSPAFEGERILTLSEFLSNFGRGKKIFLEIKAREIDPRKVIYELTQKVVSEISGKKGLLDRVNIISFNSKVLAQVHGASSSVSCMQIFEKCLPAFETLSGSAPWLNGYVVALDLLSESFVSAAHGASKTVATFTCNTEEELCHACELGVDGIISDDPHAAAKWFGSHMNKSG